MDAFLKMANKILMGAGIGGVVGAGYGYFFVIGVTPDPEENRRIKIRNTLLYGSIGAIGGGIIGYFLSKK